MMKKNKQTPIFIHSLFRSGSTFVFNQFRKSASPYWCYQEPLHEKAIFAKSDHEILLESDDSTAKVLRHPKLGKPYFWELYEVAQTCLEFIDENSPYKSFFSRDEATVNYFNALIRESKARTVIQECRTSARIGVLKRELGGTHIYLWRNPRDQWWSYKVLDYFDTANQVIINADDVPPVIELLRSEIGFARYRSTDINDEFFWFKRNKLKFDESYLVFYVLWVLSLIEARKSADLMINMDSLSSDQSYANRIRAELIENEIFDIDFDDCNSPYFNFHTSEIDRFEKIEKLAHDLFVKVGFSPSLIQYVINEKENNRVESLEKNEVAVNLVGEAFKARQLVERFNEETLEIKSIYENLNNHIATGLNDEIEQVKLEKARIEEDLLGKNLLVVEVSKELKEESLAKNEYKEKYESIINSKFWKLTHSIRRIVSFIYK